MLTVLDADNKLWHIPLIDFHTHIGKVAIETTKGASQRINRPQDILDLYEKLKFELYSRISEKPDDYYITLPKIDSFVQPMYPLIQDQIYNGLNLKGWIADQIVSFPFNDIFHTKTNPKFVKSNEYVRHSLNKFEFAFRFIPFCRVDATEELANQEIFNSVSLGARGLKLHPLSQNWIDKIVTPETKKVLRTAGRLKLPIIFDVPNKGVAKDITEIAVESREDINYPIKVVLGHNGFDYSSPEIFQYIDKTDMFTEISGMRGSDVELFFKNVTATVTNWDKKILFGTDTNYFSVLQAVDFISFLLSKKFLDLVNESNSKEVRPLEIVSNILGINALNIIPLNFQNYAEINCVTSNIQRDIEISISSADFINSLKNLVQDKETFYNIAILPLNESLEYAIYVKKQNNLYRWIIKRNNTEMIDFVLKTFPNENQGNDNNNNNIDYQKLSKFINANDETVNLKSNKENITKIMSIEELIKDNNQ